MARKKATRLTSFGEVFDLRLLKEIGFPLAFPIMPLEAFLWASAPWRFDPFSDYDISDRKITRIDANGVKHDVGMLSDKLEHHYISLGRVFDEPGTIDGDFVGSKQAIDLFKGYESQIFGLEESKLGLVKRAASSISGKGDFCRFA